MNEERVAGTFVGIVWRKGNDVSRCKVTFRDGPTDPDIEVSVTGKNRAELMRVVGEVWDMKVALRDEATKDAEAIFGAKVA